MALQTAFYSHFTMLAKRAHIQGSYSGHMRARLEPNAEHAAIAI